MNVFAEAPFAGHPTLGRAHVVRALTQAGETLTLEMKAGIIPVQTQGGVWTLVAGRVIEIARGTLSL